MRKIILKTVLGSVALLPALSFDHSEPAPVPDPEIVVASYPKDYFMPPVDANPLKLTGTFGELRPDHFHSGIEIKIGPWSSDDQLLLLRVVLHPRQHKSFLDHRNKIGE